MDTQRSRRATISTTSPTAPGPRTRRFPSDKSNYGAFTALQDLSQQRVRDILDAAKDDPDSRDRHRLFELPRRGGGRSQGPDADRALAQRDPRRSRAATGYAALAAQAARNGVTGLFGGGVGQDDRNSDVYITGLGQAGLGMPDRDMYLLNDAELRFASRGLRRPSDEDADARRRDECRRRGPRRSWLSRPDRQGLVDPRRRQRRDQDLQQDDPGPAAEARAGLRLGDLSQGARRQRRRAAGCRAERVQGHRRAVRQGAAAGAQGPADRPVARHLCRRAAQGGRPTRASPSTAPSSTAPRRTSRGGSARSTSPPTSSPTTCRRSMSRNGFRRNPRRRWSSWSATSSRRWAGASTISSWMAPETKVKAKAKLAAFTPRIGYPDQWHDYTFDVRRDDLFGNAMRANQWAHDWNIRKLGQPVYALGVGARPDDGQRPGQFQPGRDHLPGGDPAAAVLRSQCRSGGQLWRDRRGDRPRDEPSFRRPGLEI